MREDVRRDVGEPSGFFEFKRHDELNPLWEAHGDPDVATWDMGRDSRRLKSKPLLGVESSRGCATCMMDWNAQRHW